MTASGWIKGAKLSQILLALTLAGLSAYLLFLSFPTQIKQTVNPQAVHGFRVAAGILLVPMMLMLAGAYGVWREKPWGWWTAFGVDLGWLSILVYAAIDDGWDNLDPDLFALIAVSLFPLLMLLLPSVRKYYGQRSRSQLRSEERGRADARRERFDFHT